MTGGSALARVRDRVSHPRFTRQSDREVATVVCRWRTRHGASESLPLASCRACKVASAVSLSARFLLSPLVS
jgi:hypothetical protein